ncbi:MAG: hypothetical protein WB770_02865, partial [Acidimicrobiales bacterium]
MTWHVPARHVVVDGSNLATEGRTTPSLAQLEEVVDELRREMDDAQVTVVVDASFRHRIDAEERERYDQLVQDGELVSPPAGAVGRGDAFLLRIAQRVDGIVLSNDSFQEFHHEHPWLFEPGRLIGASRVPGIGWIFVLRSPVRAPTTRKATSQAKRAKKDVERAIASATKEAVSPDGARKAKPSSARAPSSDSPRAVNEPATFIAFVAEHHPGDEIDAVVERFVSHGAVVRYGDVLAYVPLAGLGEPAPKSAREALKKGQSRRFVVTALDPYRRGIEVALPGVATISGRPSAETVAAAVKLSHSRDAKPNPAKRTAKKSAATRERRSALPRKRSAPVPAAAAGPDETSGPRRSPRAERALHA